ncbi:uncharacterized protein LOC6544324 [Drosophila erecta]|uniref:Uncharacterized protein n=1 Tax=Drosophila erecta TaxID=7220 RepID=B3NDM2_DROER|nr:uncharacterized protein LOC6544324 [Drosophila erecta]EDV52155.2 uncharacterized protein Dere_GG15925 [Drosophila erecta]
MDINDSKRKKFGRKTYAFLVIFMGLAVAQWILVCLVESSRKIFRDFEIICSATFALAGIFFTIFVFNEGVRNHRIYRWLVALIIVELEIFSMYVLVARTWIPDMLAYFFFCTLLLVVALVVGCHLSFSMDITRYIAPLFILSFILAMMSSYFLLAHLFLPSLKPYAYLIFELGLTFIMTSIIMLHAQTINGDRYVQMRVKDFILAALLVFHEFLLIYALTFYWQIHYSYFTSADYFWMSTSTPNIQGTTPENINYDDYDSKASDDDWSARNESSFDWYTDIWEPTNELKLKA